MRIKYKVDFIVYALLVKNGKVINTFYSGFASGMSPGRCLTMSDYNKENLVCAGPCSRCTNIINRSGIKKVYYTVPGGCVRIDGRTVKSYTKNW